MIKKLLPRTPIGNAITAAAVILAVSPEARRFTRKMAVKGIGAIMRMAEGIKSFSGRAAGQGSHLIGEAQSHEYYHEFGPFLPFDESVQPETNMNEEIPFNVMSDQAINSKLKFKME